MIVGLIREIVPWWLVVFLLARDLVLGVALIVLRRHGYGHRLCISRQGGRLLYAFPLLFLGDGGSSGATVAGVRLSFRRVGYRALLVGGCPLPRRYAGSSRRPMLISATT